MSTARRARPLTGRQKDLLFVVGRNAPVTARDVAYHLPSLSVEAARSALSRLEWKGLLDRQYTGIGGAGSAWVLSSDGAAQLTALDIDEDYDPGEDGGDR